MCEEPNQKPNDSQKHSTDILPIFEHLKPTVRHKTTCSVPTLSNNGVEASSDKDKANLLNAFFSHLFNISNLSLSSSDSNSAGADVCHEELFVLFKRWSISF